MPRGPALIWTNVVICNNKEEIDTWLQSNTEWRFDTGQPGDRIATDRYVCYYSHKNRRGKFHCEAKMRIRYMKDLSKAYIQTTGTHDHVCLKDLGLSSPVKRKIQTLDEAHCGRTARHIQRSLQNDPDLEGLTIPSLLQVQGQKAQWARKRGFTKTLTLEDLELYFSMNREIPVEENKPYAAAFSYRYITVTDDNGVQRPSLQFLLVITSRKLQYRQSIWPSLQLDGTYKLMTLNYPLLVAGFSDADKIFYPTYVAISSHEDTWSYKGFLEAISRGNPEQIYKPRLLIADGATQITAACREVFPDAKRGMCYAHVTMDFNKELPKSRIYQAACDEIKEDVSYLAMATSLVELAAASRTLWDHWNAKWSQIPRLHQACNKFFKSWLLRNEYRGWFYRFAPGFTMFSVATNNGLEGTNKMIKDNYTQRELLGLPRFILVVEQLVEGWSIDPERKEPVYAPTIPRNPNSNLRKAVEKLREERRQFVHINHNEEHVWLIRSSACCSEVNLVPLWDELTQIAPDSQWTFTSWQRYKTLRQSFYVLKKSDVFPGYLCCTCPIGIKDELCKHTLLLMESEQMIEPLPQPLEPRKKRGRRKKVGRALEFI